MKHKLLIWCMIVGILIISSLSLVSAVDIGEYKLGDDVVIYQTCNNCTQCYFTRIIDYDDEVMLTNRRAVQDGTFYSYNISSSNFSTAGEYSYCYACGNNVENATGCIDFEVTYNGDNLTGERVTVYIISLGALLFLFLLCLYLTGKLPSSDARDEAGTIIQISMLKHLRPVLWGVGWAIIMAMIFITWNITLAYLPNTMVADLFFKIFRIVFYISMVGFFLRFIWIFVEVFRDREYKKMIERGVELNSL